MRGKICRDCLYCYWDHMTEETVWLCWVVDGEVRPEQRACVDFEVRKGDD